jgi:hypothetical protein
LFSHPDKLQLLWPRRRIHVRMLSPSEVPMLKFQPQKLTEFS